MRVLVSDRLGEIGIRMFQEEEGLDVDVKTSLPPEEQEAIIGDYDALVIRSATKVTQSLLASAKNLKVVGRAGIGLDNVDIPEATKRGIVVMNTPGGNVVTTAEHTISMMMALTRNIPMGTSSLKAGRWEKKNLQGREVLNKTLGIIGYGNIGSIVADRARGLKMRVAVHDPIVPPERIEKAGYESVSIEDLYRRADYITVHVPKLKQTTGLLNKEAFDQMKDGVMIINCARGGIVDESDLYDALMSGKVAGAALDVFAKEPPGEHPLLQLDNVIATPHLGASTREAQTNVAIAVADQIIQFLKTGTVLNAVNVPSVTGDLLVKLKPFLYVGDRLGCLLAQLIKGHLKEIAIEYAGDFLGLDMSPVTTSVVKGLLAPLVSHDVNTVNALYLAKDMGIKISEATAGESSDYLNLISVSVLTDEMSRRADGSIFGRNDPRIVRIDDVRLEMVSEGHLALIYNLDKPGAIGSIGGVLGNNNINIARMQVGQTAGGDRNVVFLRTDTPIPETVLEELKSRPLVKDVIPLEL